jgi:hypothetical protein
MPGVQVSVQPGNPPSELTGSAGLRLREPASQPVGCAWVATKVESPGFASEDTREDREGFHGTRQPRGRRKPTLLEDLLWVPPCSAGQDPSALYRAASRSDALVVLGFRRLQGGRDDVQNCRDAYAQPVRIDPAAAPLWRSEAPQPATIQCRQGNPGVAITPRLESRMAPFTARTLDLAPTSDRTLPSAPLRPSVADTPSRAMPGCGRDPAAIS